MEQVPLVYNTRVEEDWQEVKQLQNEPTTKVIDRYAHQVREWVKLHHVGQGKSDAELDELCSQELGQAPERHGVWVHYPWNRTLIHLLSEERFTEVRTDRNRNKITTEEQHRLSRKRVGIVGMSVGRAVATTMALERVFGHLKIADFDTLDLSNLNRLKAPLHDLGLPKTLSVAREIYGIDPFLTIQPYNDGLTRDNIDSFLTEGGKLDVLVDECDSLEVKLLCREKAREYGIPVVMETSDRGMLDVERFDLEPERPIFHGKVEGLNYDPEHLDPEMRWQLLMKIVDFENLSSKARLSLAEIGKTLTTWPQLASSVILGGGTVTHTVRKILLGDPVKSGRYYMDMDELILQQAEN